MIDKKGLRAKSQGMDPCIRIGKNGINEGTIQEINRLLKKKHLIKIKFLKSFIDTTDKKKAIVQLLEKTNSTLIHKIGFVVVIYK